MKHRVMLSNWLKPALSLAMIMMPLSVQASAVQESDAQQQFYLQLQGLCGKAFAGKILHDNAPSAAFSHKQLIMHVRECSDTQLKIPFHVGDDRSRTWVITRTATGLELKHDHRHRDGSHDKVTMYGGTTDNEGSAEWQSFPVDAFSIANFQQNGLTQSVTNVWHLGVTPAHFTYELTRENRRFTVVFDLNHPVPLPPAPWGHPSLTQ